MNTHTKQQTASETPVKFRTTSAYVSGAIVGTMWMPSCKGALQYSSDARSKNKRITGGRVTLRDLLESMLREDGGDFQDSQFSADTVLCIKRVAVNGSYSRVHVYEREISALPDCADLVNTEIYSNDFNNED